MLCPVDGSKMTVNQNTRFFTYNGKKYFVCCLECLNTVEKNPGKYLR
ncbi:MAG: YHS domain-containing protein [Spirochaetes bacterium]|nr:YHS domain-containing protein [Spirochaetota bacterium]